MSKFIMLIVLLPFLATAQVNKDSLAKYSYLIFGQTGPKEIKKGTCFFIRYDNRLYLVTARHLFTNWNGVKYRFDKYRQPDTLFVRLFAKNGGIHFVPIDIRKYKKVPRVHFFELPDVQVLEFKSPDEDGIYSIEKYIKQFDCRAINLIVSYGFPMLTTDAEKTFTATPSRSVCQPLNICGPFNWLNYNKVDSIDFQGTSTGNIPIHDGFSGSPAFLLNGRNVSFGGILFAGDIQRIFVRSEFVIAAVLSAAKN